MSEPQWMNEVRAMVGKEYGRVYAWDEVNAPMIRQWCEIMGTQPIADGHGKLLAPPAMLQVWCMEGPVANNYPPGSTQENPYEVLKLMEAQGFASVVAVNSELSFDRYVHEGERIYYTTRLDSVGELKTTGLGTGYFVTLIMTYFSQSKDSSADEKVGQLLFRVFKFRPANPVKPATSSDSSKPPSIPRAAPGVSDDTRFFWEGAREGKLLIQRCKACSTLRHPPAPVCIECHSFDWDTVQASGKGKIYSFVVMHYPEVPPYDYPNPVGLVELEEGTRVIAQLVGIKPADIKIGQIVQVEFNSFNDGELVLPQFRPVTEPQKA